MVLSVSQILSCCVHLNTLKLERSKRLYFLSGRKSITFLEGSQATPARPCDRNNVKVKNTLG
jgi:hypothetical protein